MIGNADMPGIGIALSDPHFTRHPVEFALVAGAMRAIPDDPVAVAVAVALVNILGQSVEMQVFHIRFTQIKW